MTFPIFRRHSLMPKCSRQVMLLLLTAGVCAVLALLGHELTTRIAAQLDLQVLQADGLQWHLLIAILTVYVLLLACPFVPGAEIGFVLLMMFGADVAPAVYGATVAALCLSYWVGRLVPQSVAVAVFKQFNPGRTADAIDLHAPHGRDETARAHVGFRTAATRILARLTTHRWLAVAILINTPGNSVLGGGGGIALTVGTGRLMPFHHFLFSIALAVAPVPLAVGVFGWAVG